MMTRRTRVTRWLRSSQRLALGLFAGAAGVVSAVVLLAGGGGAVAATTSLNATYTALDSSAGATGLQLVTAKQAETPGFKSNGPTWQTDASGSSSPLAATIRRLPATAPNITSWIAESAEGDPCLLASPNHRIHGVWVVSGGCATGPEGPEQGALDVNYDEETPGKVELAGVVPDGVTSVLVTFADGSSQTAQVNQNGWALEATGQPVSAVDQPSGYAVSLQGR
jgi:hypothetical protein